MEFFLFLWDGYNYIAGHVSPRKNMVHGRHHFHFFGFFFFFLFYYYFIYISVLNSHQPNSSCALTLCVYSNHTIARPRFIPFLYHWVDIVSFYCAIFLCISFLSRLDKSVMSMPLCHTTNFNFYFVLFFLFVSEMFFPLAGRRENQSSAVNR